MMLRLSYSHIPLIYNCDDMVTLKKNKRQLRMAEHALEYTKDARDVLQVRRDDAKLFCYRIFLSSMLTTNESGVFFC
jgi:hypothetical protein